ncbi:MAG: methionyl-tRNA formyltransferase [Haliea sp.]|uniref:methionyl-tRNA formyltransferase n=1 Tax=Haliea sp. TaxID=1932666 RepID=UPI0032ECD4F7
MASDPLRLIFAGTPEFAATHLRALLTSHHRVVAAYTQPDRPAGRGKKLQASPVKEVAAAAGIPVFQPASLRHAEAQAELAALGADVMVVVAYGLILPQPVLDAPRLGCINVHASLLPRWRGAAPIQRAIEAGDPATGITIMQMDAGLDTGAMLARESLRIAPGTSAGMLHDQLADIGPPLLLQVLDDLPAYRISATAQDEAGASYARKIEKSEAALDWQREAPELARAVAAFNPFPVCFGILGGERVRVLEAHAETVEAGNRASPGTVLSADREGILVACGEGALRIRQLQLAGARALPVADVLNARDALFAPGSRFAPVAAPESS